MSALFGKKDFRRDLLNLIQKGDSKGACEYAIKTSSNYEELGNFDDAILILKSLLELFEEKKVKEPDCFETALEKLVSLYIEVDEVDKVVENSIKLAKLKIELSKVSEAIQLIKMIDLRYKLNTAELKELINIYVSVGHYPNALRLIERVLEKEKDKDLIKFAGELLFNAGDFEKALNYFKALSVMDPENEYAKKKVDEIERILHVLDKSGEHVAPKLIPEEKVIESVREISQQELLQPKEEASQMEQTSKGEKSIEAKAEKIELKKEETEEIEQQPKELKEDLIPQKSEIPYEENKETSTKANLVNLEDIKEYTEALTYIEQGEIEAGVKILETIALDFEGKDINTAIEIYEKILLIDPMNVSVAKKISKILLDKGKTKEAAFYLRSAANSFNPKVRLEALLALKELLPNDENVRKRIFDAYLELNNIEEAIENLKWFSGESLNDALEKLFGYVLDNLTYISKVSKFINSKNIDSAIKFKYFYRTFELFLEANDKVEGIKWLIKANSIHKLSLEDYIKGAEILKGLKLPEEAEIIAQSIYDYIELQNDPMKAYELSLLIIDLGINKPLYYAKHLELAKRLNKGDVVYAMAKKIIEHNAVQYAELVYDSMKDNFKNLDKEELVKFTNYFEVAGLSHVAYELNLEILKLDPFNSQALAKTFLFAVEKGDERQIISFLEKFPPSASYASIVEPVIERYSSLKTKNPFDPYYHFVIGFLYYFVERYEEAVAYFQFVLRSNRSKALMRLMLSICFEKTMLFDFALKQLELGLSEDGIPEVKKEILYRYAVMKKNVGDVVSARKALKELLSVGEYKDARILLEALPSEGKIIDIRGEEK